MYKNVDKIMNVNSINGQTKVACVIGNPIQHSVSPLIHNYWIAQNKLNAAYIALTAPIEKFETVLEGLLLSGMVGCNITLPFKEKAYHFVDYKTDAANDAKAVNTIYFDTNNRLWGDNSDGIGFVKSVHYQYGINIFQNKSVLVIGAGGAARGIIRELMFLNLNEIIVINRTLEKAENLVKNLQSLSNIKIISHSLENIQDYLPRADIIIQTTSIGIKDTINYPISLKNTKALCLDIVYKPFVTSFMQEAQKYNLSTMNGLGMLIHQATVGFEKWFGIKPIIDKNFISNLENSL
jgi:shikimate dehydrogenase